MMQHTEMLKKFECNLLCIMSANNCKIVLTSRQFELVISIDAPEAYE